MWRNKSLDIIIIYEFSLVVSPSLHILITPIWAPSQDH